MPQGGHENEAGAALVLVLPVVNAAGYDGAGAEQRNDDDCVENANHELTPSEPCQSLTLMLWHESRSSFAASEVSSW